MKLIKIFNFLILLIIISSCVTNKQYTYFQEEDLNKEDLVKDSIYRSYKIESFDYELRPFDIINIRFYSFTGEELNIFKREQSTDNRTQQGGDAALLGGYLIDQNGDLSFPIVGKVNFEGLTLYEAEEKLTTIAKEFVEEPVVEVKLLNYRFNILGEVNNENTYSTFNYAITIPEAISLAGGLTDLADKSNIKIIRRNGENNVVFYVNLLDEDFFANSNQYIHPNDIIIVPPLKQRPFRKYFSQNLSVFNSSVSVLLVGLNLYFLLSTDSN